MPVETAAPSSHQVLRRNLLGRLSPNDLSCDPGILKDLAPDVAGVYSLTPRLAVTVRSEEDVSAVMRECSRLRLPLTFRAAGTSLSGQAISDSTLVLLGPEWSRVSVEAGGAKIRLGCGVVGMDANRALAPLGTRIGPDPASIAVATVGGIVANNASGMGCGTARNSYATLSSMRMILHDGTILDTGDADSMASFVRSHRGLLDRLSSLALGVRCDLGMSERIREKFRVKNTTGYGLNSLVDHEDLAQILQHLMVGSEGTLGFISEVVLKTIPSPPRRAAALILFHSLNEACAAAAAMSGLDIEAAELMDQASLMSVAGDPSTPESLRSVPPGSAALLIEVRAHDDASLKRSASAVLDTVGGMASSAPFPFSEDGRHNSTLWGIRKGLFYSVWATRTGRNSVIIEDVAFPINRLAEATLDLGDLLRSHGYASVVFGHALHGNLHFMLQQDFSRPEEVRRYRRFIEEMCRMVLRYGGSLKAEHGTGRAMAPFVEREWGHEAYLAMKQVKDILDPNGILNPGVVITDDPEAHVRNLRTVCKEA